MAARNPGSAVEGKVLGRPGGEPGPPRAYTVRRMAAARTFQADKAKTPISFETGVLGMVSLTMSYFCLLYTSDAADEEDSGGIGGRRIYKKKKRQKS